jgi:alkyl hydroperoxide reductase subunit AhpF
LNVLGHLVEPVRIIHFTQKFECGSCAATHQLLDETAALSDKLQLEVYDFVADQAKADELGIERVPAIALLGDRDYGIRFYGPPAGYEFASLLQDFIMISARDSGLSADTREMLKGITKPVHLEVLVTPT